MEEVILSNKRVRIIRSTLEPGESTGERTRNDRVLVHLNDHEKAHTMDGITIPLARNMGDAHYVEASSHEVTNCGSTPVTTLIIELL